MAIYRTISLSFWTDSKIVDDFTPEDRYFFMYLITNPHSNLCGCYEISIKQASNETGYSTETIRSLIDRFSRVHNVIRYSNETKEVLILNWHKYNWTKSDKFRKPLMKEIALVKDASFRDYLEKMACDEDVEIPEENNDGYGIDTKCIDTDCTDTHCIDTKCSDTPVTVTVSVTDTVSDTVSVTDTEKDKIKDNNNKAKDKKHIHGEYKKVLLADDELEKLNSEFGEDKTSEAIKYLDEYIAEKGYKSKSHYLTIRRWVMTALDERKNSASPKNNKRGSPNDSGRLDWVDKVFDDLGEAL